ncbi:hypothetical protein CsSME_00038155 [Camellia sinensis var. sinensis]
MNQLKSFFKSEESIVEFKALYSIPEDIVVRLPILGDSILEGSEEQIPLLLINIVEGGVKFPFHPPLREVLVKHQLVQMLLNLGKAPEVFSYPSEWEDQVNLPLLQRAWSYRGPPEQQGQGRTTHVFLSYTSYYGIVIATGVIDLGADSGFHFYILFHLRKNIEAAATISEIMPLKNFLEVTVAKKCERIASATFAS